MRKAPPPSEEDRTMDAPAATTTPAVYLSGAGGDYLSRWKRIVLLDQRLRAAAAPGGRAPGVKALAALCGVSVKTIRRDLEAMRVELGAPIEYAQGARGWRYADGSFAVPAAALSERDLFALMVAENALAQYEGTPLAASLRAALDKVLATLPGEVRDRHALAARAVHFGGLPPPRIAADVWSALAAAIDGREHVEVVYHRAGAREPVRRAAHLAPPPRSAATLGPAGGGALRLSARSSPSPGSSRTPARAARAAAPRPPVSTARSPPRRAAPPCSRRPR
jgi:hypothetical protein